MFAEKKKTRIAGLHADNSKPVAGEEITIAGYLQFYDNKTKRWEPLRAWVKLYVDGIEVDRTATKPNGSFKFRYSSNVTGKKKVEVRFAGDNRFKPCRKEISIEVVTQEQRKRTERFVKLALIIFFTLIVVVFVLSIVLSKW